MESGTDLLNVWFCRLIAEICYLIFYFLFFLKSNIQIQYLLNKVIYDIVAVQSHAISTF